MDFRFLDRNKLTSKLRGFSKKSAFFNGRVARFSIVAFAFIWTQAEGFSSLHSKYTLIGFAKRVVKRTADYQQSIGIRLKTHQSAIMQSCDDMNTTVGVFSKNQPQDSSKLQFKVNATELSSKVYGALMVDYDEIIPGPDPQLKPVRPLRINLDLLTYHARRAVLAGNMTEGINLYRKCTVMDPRDGRAWLALGRIESRRNRFDLAEKIFLRGLKYCPRNPYILQAYGVMEETRGNKVKALELFSKATLFDKKHAASWVAKAKLLQSFGKIEEARSALQTAHRVDPNNYYALQVLAVLEREEGNLELARELFQKCAKVNPNNAAVYQSWGLLESQLGNIDKARELFQKGLQENPQSIYTLQAWAVLEANVGKNSEALRLLRKAMSLRPKEASVIQTYAILLKKQGQTSEARQAFKEATQADPQHAPSWQAWGIMEAELGCTKKAREIFQQGIWGCTVGKNVVRIWQAWAILEADEGNLEVSRQYFQYAVKKAPQTAQGLTPVLLAWSLIEERAGKLERAQQLLSLCLSYPNASPMLRQLYDSMETRQGVNKDTQKTTEIKTSQGREDKKFQKPALVDVESLLGLQSTAAEIEAVLQRFGRKSFSGSGILWEDDFMNFKMT